MPGTAIRAAGRPRSAATARARSSALAAWPWKPAYEYEIARLCQARSVSASVSSTAASARSPLIRCTTQRSSEPSMSAMCEAYVCSRPYRTGLGMTRAASNAASRVAVNSSRRRWFSRIGRRRASALERSTGSSVVLIVRSTSASASSWRPLCSRCLTLPRSLVRPSGRSAPVATASVPSRRLTHDYGVSRALDDMPDEQLMPPSVAVREAVRILSAHGVASPRVNAEELTAYVLGVPRSRLALAPGMTGGQYARLRVLVDARAGRVPLQHLTGTAPFRHLLLSVGPGVFVPRPETE